MTKHTPGPWTSYSVSTDTSRRVGPPKYAVAEIKPTGRHQEDAANANLIAAAPDLLEALRDILFNSVHGNGLDAHYKAQDRARAVIAKAEGL